MPAVRAAAQLREPARNSRSLVRAVPAEKPRRVREIQERKRFGHVPPIHFEDKIVSTDEVVVQAPCAGSDAVGNYSHGEAITLRNCVVRRVNPFPA